ncbi:MAG: sigma-70 family RNA polymerase sigma factor [Phycisphaerae bacterium]|nr:sigma-70 family RNA polymerase sigma factor [Phycisphaerae bacterium]
MCNFDQKTQELVILAKEGDDSALEQLCRVYSERVRRVIRLRMGKEIRPRLDSMDLVQDALLSALGGLGDFTYKNEGDFLRWLTKIAENRLRDNIDKLYTAKRDIRKEVRLENYEPTTGSGFVGTPGAIEATTPSVIMSKKEDLDKLEKAIDELKPDYRKVIVLSKIDGLSYKEIGDRLGKSIDSVGHLLSRAMVALTEAFWTI